jgi:DNA-binding response OmpR family regulator
MMARVLVVDDNRELADDLVEILAAEGHEARAAYDGEQAIHAAREYDYDAALVDIRMPRMDGVTLVKHLMHDHPRRTHLFMTAFADASTMVEALAMSSDAVLDKPLDFPRLLRLVNAAARERASV